MHNAVTASASTVTTILAAAAAAVPVAAAVVEVVITVFRALFKPRNALFVIHWACPVVAVHMASDSEVHSVLL
jgi:hypothetical protein